MADLTIGRIGLKGVTLENVESWRLGAGGEVRLSGYIRGANLAETNELRQAFKRMEEGSVVPVTWSVDPEIDGFYWFRWADLVADADEAALNDPGYIKFVVLLERIGNRSDIWFQSRLTGTVRDNDFGLTESNVTPIVAPPTDSAVWWGNFATPTSVVRTSEDGSIRAFHDTDIFTLPSPRWDIGPNEYYNATAELLIDGAVQTGLEIKDGPETWLLSNGLVRITPNSTDKGKFDFSYWDGAAWSSPKTFILHHSGSSQVTTAWDSITCLRNTPHAVVIRLAKVVATGGRILVVDLTLRRGVRHIEMRVNQSLTRDMRLNVGEALTAFSIAGTTHNVGVRTSDFHLMGSARSLSINSTAGTIGTSTNTRSHDFWVGVAVGGSSAVAGDGSTAIARQYLAGVSEQVGAVLR